MSMSHVSIPPLDVAHHYAVGEDAFVVRLLKKDAPYPLRVFMCTAILNAYGATRFPILSRFVVGDDGTVPEIPHTVVDIICRHLRGDRDLLMCQDELIDAGFEKWARL